MLRPNLLSLAGLMVCAVAAAPAGAQTGPADPLQPALPPLTGPQISAPPPGAGTAVAPGDAQGGSSRAARMVAKFRAANTTNDGRLTMQQAQAAGLTPVVKHFAELDPTNRGYITLQDIRSYIQRMRATRAQANPME